DADHRIRHAIQMDHLIENGGICMEAAAPQRIAQHHLALFTGSIFFTSERATQCGRDTQRRKECPRNLRAFQHRRVARVREIEVGSLEGAEEAKCLRLLLECMEVNRAPWKLVEATNGYPGW